MDFPLCLRPCWQLMPREKRPLQDPRWRRVAGIKRDWEVTSSTSIPCPRKLKGVQTLRWIKFKLQSQKRPKRPSVCSKIDNFSGNFSINLTCHLLNKCNILLSFRLFVNYPKVFFGIWEVHLRWCLHYWVPLRTSMMIGGRLSIS